MEVESTSLSEGGTPSSCSSSPTSSLYSTSHPLSLYPTLSPMSPCTAASALEPSLRYFPPAPPPSPLDASFPLPCQKLSSTSLLSSCLRSVVIQQTAAVAASKAELLLAARSAEPEYPPPCPNPPFPSPSTSFSDPSSFLSTSLFQRQLDFNRDSLTSPFVSPGTSPKQQQQHKCLPHCFFPQPTTTLHDEDHDCSRPSTPSTPIQGMFNLQLETYSTHPSA